MSAVHYSDTYPVTVYYDASCPLCNAEMTNLMLRNLHGRLRFTDVSATPGHSELPGVSWSQMMAIIHARCADGRVVSGVEVFRLAYEAVGLGWVTAITNWPIIGSLCERFYPVLAANRNRIPRWMVIWIFESQARRAAKKWAERHGCDQGQCGVNLQKGEQP